MYATFWSLVPPLVAIILALITKEVYSSLFVGILMGALFAAGFNLEGTMNTLVDDGFTAALSNSSNVGILIFLVILGTIVCMMNKAGGSAAFGEWAKTHIKSRVGAQIVTIILGMLIFVDDYFNCLTVGSVMKPVAKKHNVSASKLSYLIDATAAPICIIAPISSWAAAVTSYVEREDGFTLFLQSIPYNYYALLTITFMIGMVLMKIDFGPMKKYESLASAGKDAGDEIESTSVPENIKGKGKVFDLIFPVAILIIACVFGMIYTGGFFEGENFIDAFANCSASKSLVIGSVIALILTIIVYLIRRVISFRECMACIPEGFKSMVPAILILTMAWTLKNMTDALGASEFVDTVVSQHAEALQVVLPAIIFLIAVFISFSTGTSWGTFGILIPIVVELFENIDPTMMIISISACMAGAVCGDHCSPISDTTIMASAGAKCDHVKHVSTQLPYAVTVAAISFVMYFVASLIKNAVICLIIGLALTIGTLFVIKAMQKKKSPKTE
ncbi:MAG: Na+/H+ antiporter NhaC family protein [Oscillospiraceae bacterium]|nr:Na+/H+ antiporter NhaC family protein [Oscillospiraceae bacterium]